MSKCDCGCGQELTGRAARFVSDEHRQRFWSNARKRGAQTIGKAKSKPHCGDPVSSDRLRKTLGVFFDIKSPTTLDIQQRTGSMKPSTDIDDLRRAGYPISKAIYVRTTDDGRRVYRYEKIG